jgi:Asp/Glu/hydantoin racemase
MTPSNQHPLVALISGTPAAVAPATAAFAEDFPAATVWNILDDRLLVEANQKGGVTAELHERMTRLIRHATEEGANGIVLTCSMYGAVAHDRDGLTVPVLASDDAAFADAIGSGYARILIVASFETALVDANSRFLEAVRAAGATVSTVSAVPEGAFAATQAGDAEALAASLIEGCRPCLGQVDAILLAQYSLAPAADTVAAALGLPVLSGPVSAARLLRRRIEGGAGS